jgi:Zn-finger nucleic acid-binding protein
MELFERRRYYFCRYCGTFHFLDTPEADGVRILETPAQALRCTRCGGALATALLDADHPVKCCTTCRGVLLPRTTFAHVVHTRRTWATGTPVTPEPLERAALERALSCPACSTRMATHPYYGPGNVIMDSCDTCNLVWLDPGELRQISDAPGSDRGLRKGPQRDTSNILLPRERASLSAGTTLEPLDLLIDLLS